MKMKTLHNKLPRSTKKAVLSRMFITLSVYVEKKSETATNK